MFRNHIEFVKITKSRQPNNISNLLSENSERNKIPF